MDITELGNRINIVNQVKVAQDNSLWDSFVENSEEIRRGSDEGSEGMSGASEPLSNLSPDSERMSVSDFVVEKMKSYGYPERKINERRSDIVKEEANVEQSGDIVENIIVEIPYIKYPAIGDTKVREIDIQEVKDFSKEILDKFNLRFLGAKKEKKSWVMTFTSKEIQEEAVIEEDPIDNILDEIYGTKSTGQNKTKKVASLEINWENLSKRLSERNSE
jgi:hypothetical protein